MKKGISAHQKWYDFADNDLKFARVGLREHFYAQTCFHSQQAVEKALKGFLLFRGKMYPKSHSLMDLAGLIGEKWLNTHIKPLQVLDEFYVPTRYPDAAAGTKPGGPPNEKDAEDAVALAGEILQAIFKRSAK